MSRDGAAAAAGGDGETPLHACIGKVCVLCVQSPQVTVISTRRQVAQERIAHLLYVSGSAKGLPIRAVASSFTGFDKYRKLHKSRKLRIYAADGS